jgi:glycosyltransferase involved in cell wall biosynthesis
MDAADMVLNTRGPGHLPLITVITAVFNGGKYIEQTIKSVLGQTYDKIQYIIIDGGSSDGTVEIIRKYNDVLSWISEKDTGVYDAWNKGIRRAEGDWIVFLGADDYFWNEHVVSDALGTLEEANRLGRRLVYGKVSLLSDTGQLIDTVGQAWELAKNDFTRFMSVIHCGAFHAKSLFTDNGLFNTQFRIAGDYEFLLREFTRGGEFMFWNAVIAGMRTGGLSANPDLRLTVAREERMAQSMNHLSPGLRSNWNLVKAILIGAVSKIIGARTANRWINHVRSGLLNSQGWFSKGNK